MRLTRVHCPSALEPGRDVELPEAAAQHVSQVLRLRAGDALVLFDGRGDDCDAELVSASRGRATARVLARRPGMPESPLAVTLVQALSRAERMDLTLQKATELGVHAIQTVASVRSVVRLDDDQATRKARHWRAIVASACEQSGRSRVPSVREPLPLREYLALPSSAGRRIVLDPLGQGSLDGTESPAGAGVDLLIGPEGGFDDEELAAAEAAGFVRVRFGPRVLRTETAGLAALAVMQALWGDLLGPRET